jgi:DNA-binding SARP family transcriptional activator
MCNSAHAEEPAGNRPNLVLHLFGGPYVTLDGCRREVPEGSKRLLAFVALQRRRVERRHAAGALWPSGGERRAAGNLRSALWRLRGAGIEVLTADNWSLSLQERVEVDVRLVNAWADRMIGGTRSTAEDLRVAPAWIDALDLLPGWYEDWALIERERLRQRTLHALEALSRSLVAEGRHADAVEAAMLAVGAEPLRESAQTALIEAHLAERNLVEARRCYRTYQALLDAELGVAPSAQLQTLVRSMTTCIPKTISVSNRMMAMSRP